MTLFGAQLGKMTARRALALLASLALLYFAAGGAFLHEHKAGGNDTPCHVCQALHLPALSLAATPTADIPEFQSRLISHVAAASPSEGLSLDRAGRAPPAA
jgi:hypothetical protein